VAVAARLLARRAGGAAGGAVSARRVRLDASVARVVGGMGGGNCRPNCGH
jgi:hypothetical protein